MDDIRIRTNNVPRLVVDAYELSPAERADFDYLDWDALEDGKVEATFVRYLGVTYDLGEFTTTYGLPEGSPLRQWDGYLSDSFFSGVLVRYCADDNDRVVLATFLS